VDATENRRAHNETLLREVNERVEEVATGFSGYGEDDGLLIGFICECGRDDCSEPLEVTHAQYEAVRSSPRRFLVVPGHEHTRCGARRRPTPGLPDRREDRRGGADRGRARSALVGERPDETRFCVE
jgi:hypothetical protein